MTLHHNIVWHLHMVKYGCRCQLHHHTHISIQQEFGLDHGSVVWGAYVWQTSIEMQLWGHVQASPVASKPETSQPSQAATAPLPQAPVPAPTQAAASTAAPLPAPVSAPSPAVTPFAAGGPVAESPHAPSAPAAPPMPPSQPPQVSSLAHQSIF